MKHPLTRAVLTFALVVLPLTLACAQGDGPPLPIGSRAPAFTTKTLAGKPFSLASQRGHVVLLDYWATWCGPCRMATPTLEMLHKKFASRGLRVVGVSVDDPSSVGQVPAFVKQMHVTYTICASPVADAHAAERYNATGIPSQYLIDKKGIVRWAQAGFSTGEGKELGAMIRKLEAE
jgi:peroxiredoxin